MDIVISTVPGKGVQDQVAAATAAKAASVKLFVPTEFGLPTQNAIKGILLQKKNFQEKLRELDLPYSLFFTGPWTDFIFIP